jgi:hypothetical protein
VNSTRGDTVVMKRPRTKGAEPEIIASPEADQARAKALLREEQQRDGQQAMIEYQEEQKAMQRKTARLRAQRLARDQRETKKANANKKRK